MPGNTPVNQASEVKQNLSGFDTPESKPKNNAAKWLVVIVIIAIIIIGGLWLVSKYSKFNILGINTAGKEWHAIFLTNGQVYFGKVGSIKQDVLVLSEIYYLQVTQPLQVSGEQPAQQQLQNELALVKLGNELHGPQDEMRINRDHILFTEVLKNDSKVVEAIEESKRTE